MDTSETLKLLALSKKAEKVLIALQNGTDTPLLLARATSVSRTAIYAILKNLKERGLAHSRVVGGKKHWLLTTQREIEGVLYAAKRTLFKIPEGSEEVHGLSDSTVIIHRGQEAIRKVLGELLLTHKNERFYSLVGDSAAAHWNNMFSLQATNRFNRTLKSNNIIAETVLEEGALERMARELGISWAKDFEGRTTRVNVMDGEYFNYAAQVFIFKESIYLMALNEELIIEIRNSEIQKMLLSFMRFIQDNSRAIDANEILRRVIADMESEKINA